MAKASLATALSQATEQACAHLTDEQLLDKCFSTQYGEFIRLLVKRHATDLYRLCRYRLPSPDLAEDAVQETFLALWQCKKPPENLRAWLSIVAKRKADRIARREKSRRERESAQRADTTTGSPEAESARREVVHWALSGLPELYRVPLTLHYLERLTAPEVAERLGRTRHAVERQIERGLDMLRRRLGRADVGLAALASTAATADTLSAGRVGTIVAAALQEIAEPRRGIWPAPAAAWMSWRVRGAAVVLLALGLAGGWAATHRPPAESGEIAPSPPASAGQTETLEAKNLRILRAEVLPRAVAALRPMVAGGGGVRVLSSRAEGSTVEAILEGEHRIGEWHPRSRVRLSYCVLARALRIDLDTWATGTWKPIDPNAPMILGFTRENSREVQLGPVDELKRAFEYLPPDERAPAEVVRTRRGPDAASGFLAPPRNVRCVSANSGTCYVVTDDEYLFARDTGNAGEWRCLGTARNIWGLAADDKWLYGACGGQLLIRPAKSVVCDWGSAGALPSPSPDRGMAAAGGLLFILDRGVLWGRPAGPIANEWKHLGTSLAQDGVLGAASGQVYWCHTVTFALYTRPATLAEETWRSVGVCPKPLQIIGWNGELLGRNGEDGSVYTKSASDASAWRPANVLFLGHERRRSVH